MFEINWKKDETVYKNLLNIKGISHTTAIKLCGFLGISTKTVYKNLASHKLDQLNLVLSIYSKKTNPISLNSLANLDPVTFNVSILNENVSTSLPRMYYQNNINSSLGDNYNQIKHTPILNSLDTWTKENLISLIELNTYRGRRFKHGYPVKGQRTRTNGKTAHKLNRIKY